RVAQSCAYGPARIELVSLMTGAVATEELRSASYWVQQVRQAVRFTDGMSALQGRGGTHYLECGPEGVLSARGAECVGSDAAARFVSSQRKGRGESASLIQALGELHVGGVAVDWERALGGYGGRVVDAPTYAFQREHYWLTEQGQRQD